MTIAIAGASGNLGRKTADILLERIDPAEIVLVTRDPDRLAAYARRGVEVRSGDFDRPEGLPAAFAGVERLLLISASDVGRRIPQHLAAVEGARAAGVGHVVYTSIANPTETNPAAVVVEHRATEAGIEASGLAWTFLRDGIYAEVEVGAVLGALGSGRLVHNHGAGASAFVARDDVAAVAAAVLTTDGHASRAYEVTGPARLTADDLAAVASQVSGRTIEAVAVDDATYTAGLVEHAGLPEPVAASYATFGQAIREGHLAGLTDLVERLTGRPATPFAEVLRGSLAVAAQR
jgi:NAD(P)H dehydrogenase (quinone)